MEADKVSLLLIAPCANRELLNNVTSPNLGPFGSSVPVVWARLVQKSRSGVIRSKGSSTVYSTALAMSTGLDTCNSVTEG